MFRGGWGTGATSELSVPSLETAAALQVMKQLWPERMVRVAELSLGDSTDSPALLELATLSGRDLDEATGLFAQALIQLGIKQPDLVSAARMSVDYWAREVLEGRLAWRSGVAFMWEMLTNHFWDDWENLPDDLSAIGGLEELDDNWEQYQDSPWLRDRIERDVYVEIAALLGLEESGTAAWSEGLIYDKAKGWVQSSD